MHTVQHLLIARLNLLNTYHDYYNAQWNKDPSTKEYETISRIISWNLWQMDGLPDTTKTHKKQKDAQEDTTPRPQHNTHCMIRLWKHLNPQEEAIPLSECEEQ